MSFWARSALRRRSGRPDTSRDARFVRYAAARRVQRSRWRPHNGLYDRIEPAVVWRDLRPGLGGTHVPGSYGYTGVASLRTGSTIRMLDVILSREAPLRRAGHRRSVPRRVRLRTRASS